MLRALKLIIFAAAVFASMSAIPFSEHTETVMRKDWPSYENGASVLALPQFRSILEKFDEDDRNRVEIRYPGGDSGRQWAQSISQWFVTFGVPASYLQLLAGSGASDQLVIALIDRR
jgi:hypothetical protein